MKVNVKFNQYTRGNELLLVVGEAEEVKSVWRAMRNAWRDGKISARPSHTSFPCFREGSLYGIVVMENYEPMYMADSFVFYVVNSETIARFMTGTER